MSIAQDNLDKLNKVAGLSSGSNVNCDVVGDNVVFGFFMNMLGFIQEAALAIGPGNIATSLVDDYCRVFVKNDSGGDVSIEFSLTFGNGIPVVLQDGVTYAMPKSTAEFFVTKALEQGVVLDIVDLTEYLSTGVDDVFGI